jgi:hypothetical protein
MEITHKINDWVWYEAEPNQLYVGRVRKIVINTNEIIVYVSFGFNERWTCLVQEKAFPCGVTLYA